MRVLLAGAGGAIGSHLVPRLHAAGHSVLGLSRTESGARRVRAQGADAVVADLLDADSLGAAVRGRRADAIVHQATALDRAPMRHRDLYRTNALRTTGTRNLLDVAGAVGAGRFVTQSFFLGYGYRDHGPGRLTEEHPFAAGSTDAFDVHLRAMRSNESQVLGAPGVDGIALRYGMFYGADRSTRRLFDLARRGLLPATNPGGATSLIHLDDAAAATVAALERGGAGEAYNIVDDHPVEYGDFFRAIATAVGGPSPRTVPGVLLRPLPYLHALLVRTRIALANDKARTTLDWTPRFRCYRAGLLACAAAAARQGVDDGPGSATQDGAGG